MDESALSHTALPRRKSARVATDAFADQLDSDSLTGGSDDGREASVGKRRAPVQRKYGKRAKLNKATLPVKERAKSNTASAPKRPQSALPGPVAVSSLSVPPRPRPRPRTIAKKASTPPPLPLTDLDDISDLTSLPSSETGSMSPDEVEFVGPISKPIVPRTATVQASTSQVKRGNEPAWKATSLGTYVWVLIDPHNWDVYDPKENIDDDQERLWWPGKIQSPNKNDLPLKIKLFGEKFKYVQIHRPSDASILAQSISLLSLRFTIPTYFSPRSISVDDLLASPRKKQRREGDQIERKWKEAVNEMKADAKPLPADSDNDSDSLPEYLFSQIDAPAPSKPDLCRGDSKISTTKKGKRKRNDNSDSNDDVDAIAADMDEASLLMIPGELIYAKDKVQSDLYWPARIEEYTPPEKSNQKGKYTVLWLDGSRGDVFRAWFHVMTDPKFATCKLGKIDSRVIEVVNDEEGDEDIHSRNNFSRRSPSPTPSGPPPSSEDFTKLSIREQFAYTKNVLQAILNDAYKPSKKKHDKFIAGGHYRRSVVDAAWRRGSMDPKDVDLLQMFIREWCLRDGGQVVKRDSLSPDPSAVREEGGEAEGGMPLEPSMAGPSLTGNGQDDLGSMRFVSPPLTDALVSSPPEMPPSSCPTSRAEPEPSFVSEIEPGSDAEMSPPPSSFLTASVAATEPLTIADDGINNELSELANTDECQTVPEPASRPRQPGCADFESLTPVEKVDYCTNVLLPEAICQILLWRTGNRNSIELLSEEEEQNLSEKGQTLLQEKDWVMDIKRAREAKIRELKAKEEKKALKAQREHGRNGSSSTRPRRNVLTPKYHE